MIPGLFHCAVRAALPGPRPSWPHAVGKPFTFTTVAGNFDVLGTPKGSGGYEALARTATQMDVGGITVVVASLDDLIAMKRAAARPKDLIEVEVLAAVRDERERK